MVISAGLATSPLLNNPSSDDERNGKAIAPSVKIPFNILNGAITAKTIETLQQRVATLEGRLFLHKLQKNHQKCNESIFFNELPEKFEATPAPCSLTGLQGPLNQQKSSTKQS